MRASAGLLATSSLLAVLCASSAASAQNLPSLDTRTWRPSVDPTASLVLESTSVPGPWNWNVGAFLDWAYRPISVRDANPSSPTFGQTLYRPVDSVLETNLVANLGLGEHASLGIVLPAVLYQAGSSNLPAEVATQPVASTALGDLGLSAKVRIASNDNGGFGLAAIAGATLPTGDQSSFAGEGAVTAQLRLIADYSFVVADVQASLGYFVRTEERTWPAASAGGYTFGDEIPFSFGVRLRPDIFHIDREDRQTWELAVQGWLPGGPVAPFVDRGAAALSPVMLALSDRIALGRDKDAYLLAGAEIGLSDAVGDPGFRVIVGAGWAPREHDKDHDGVPDNVDQCEDIPEDRDGFEDSDGCPDIDNDNDGIIDREDACPNVAGTRSSDPKKNGCPGNDGDGDGIPDDVDACPTTKGVQSSDPKRNGCPAADRDGDGIPDDLDKCPDQPEDKDGFQDDDGCPDPDNDGDGVADAQDVCRDIPGEPSTDPRWNGCPNPDRDGDTFLNDKDECPDAAEVFNGIKDDDGCPDEGGKPLVTVDAKLVVRLASPIKVGGAADAPAIDPASIPTLRALAFELNKHRDWTLAVAAKPTANTAAAQGESLARSLTVVNALTQLTRRDGAAETVGWDAVKSQPTAPGGLGLLLFAAPPAPTTPPPATTKPAAPTTTKPATPPAEKK